MDTRAFDLFDAINREGLDNSHWGVGQEVSSTKDYFGSIEDLKLKGQFVYVYRSHEDRYWFFVDRLLEPDFILSNGIDGFIDIYLV
jgi:hypothetical protein